MADWWSGAGGIKNPRRMGDDGARGGTLQRVNLSGQRDGLIAQTVRGGALGEEGRGAAVRQDAGRWSHRYRQHGGAVEEGLEKTSHFLQLLTDSGHLMGEDAHLERREPERRVMDG